MEDNLKLCEADYNQSQLLRAHGFENTRSTSKIKRVIQLLTIPIASCPALHNNGYIWPKSHVKCVKSI